MGYNQPTTTRRNALKALSTGAVVSVVPITVSRAQQPKPEQIYERARKIHLRTGDSEKSKEFLRDHGFKINSREVSATAPDQLLDNYSSQSSEGDSSPQKVDENHIEGNVSIRYSSDSVYRCGKFEWEINLEPPTDSGAKPPDVTGLYWPSSDYSRIDDSEEGGGFVDLPTDDPTVGALDPSGIAVNYRDFDHHEHQSEEHPYDGDFGSWMDVKLLPEIPDDPPESRLLTANYTHTWRDYPIFGNIKNVSIGAFGVNVSLSWGASQWENEWDQGEDGSET